VVTLTAPPGRRPPCVTPHHTADQLAALIRAETRARVARRLTAARWALRGHTAAAIAAQVLLSDRQVRTGVARYHAGGAEALADRTGRGRKGPLTAAQEQRLEERLRAGPTEADGVCALRGEDVRRILADEFGVPRSLPATYDLLHRLGFAPLRPRPRRPKADPEAQAAFKKTCRGSSPRSRPPTPASGSNSGSRTRPASASRGR
jgi:transposase